jgi:hypothetical protein
VTAGLRPSGPRDASYIEWRQVRFVWMGSWASTEPSNSRRTILGLCSTSQIVSGAGKRDCASEVLFLGTARLTKSRWPSACESCGLCKKQSRTRRGSNAPDSERAPAPAVLRRYADVIAPPRKHAPELLQRQQPTGCGCVPHLRRLFVRFLQTPDPRTLDRARVLRTVRTAGAGGVRTPPERAEGSVLLVGGVGLAFQNWAVGAAGFRGGARARARAAPGLSPGLPPPKHLSKLLERRGRRI